VILKRTLAVYAPPPPAMPYRSPSLAWMRLFG